MNAMPPLLQYSDPKRTVVWYLHFELIDLLQEYIIYEIFRPFFKPGQRNWHTLGFRAGLRGLG